MEIESYVDKILNLEKEIAYYFGVMQPDLVARHYIEAVKLADRKGQISNNDLKALMLPHLEAAYAEVKRQTVFNFNVHKAAYWELELIMANMDNAPFEQEYELLLCIYKEVFGTMTHNIQSSALLRTFLYKYKNHLLAAGVPISDSDVDFLKLMAERTEIELQEFCRRPNQE